MKKRAVYWLVAVFAVSVLSGCAAPEDKTVSIIQLTDPQLNFYSTPESFEKDVTTFTRAIAAANRLNPDFVIVTGDLVNTPFDAEQIKEYNRIGGLLKPTIPLYNLPGNHDVGNAPTAEDISAYNEAFGADYYTIEQDGLFAVVLNSLYLHHPEHVMDKARDQETWLEAKLAEAHQKKDKNVVVFLHHSLFLNRSDEADEYFNIPTETRMRYLELFKKYGVSHIFSGHYHRNAFGTYDGMEMVTSGPVGQPLGADPSGLRIINISGGNIRHQYFPLDSLPEDIHLAETN